jgi:hypothetical protein
MEYKQIIDEWITMDDKINELRTQEKQIRERKAKLEAWLVSNADKIQNGNKIKVVQNNVIEPLTFRYLERVLCDIVQGDEKVTKIIGLIKEKREIKPELTIKRMKNI